MLDISHTLTNMKRGVIIPLYKGDGKKKSDPNSYRAISLCYTIIYFKYTLEKCSCHVQV